MDQKGNLKIFFIKLASVTFAIIIIINVIFNLIFADKIEKIDQILSLDKSKFRNELREKIRNEIRNGLEKDKILNEEDKILLYNLYKKIEQEFKEIENR
tara:strand:- start:137 stop:433 length:297 start_codon:yes stop_codon:yes gene_type:complete